MNRVERAPFAANIYEKKILKIIFFSAGIPVIIVMGFFYCLFADISYSYLTSKMADEFLYQFIVLSFIVIVYYFLLVGIIAYHFIHRLLGTFPRIVNEMDEKIQHRSRTHIRVRKEDYFKEIINRINSMIDQLPK